MNPNSLDALTGLLEERRRYEGWLAQLELRRGQTPGHVLDKVRVDYLERLRGVTEQLRGRASELDTSATAMASSIAALLAEETTRRDERAETELRASVGEFSEEAARDTLARCDQEIAQLAGQRSALGAELARIQDVLAQIAAPLPAAASSGYATAAPAPAAPPPPAATVAAPFDELAFLQSVVQKREAPAPAAPAAAPAASPMSAHDASSVATGTDYMPQPSLSTGRRPVPLGGPNESASEGLGARLPTMTPDGVAAFFKDVPAEQAKTLKCAECGTMNYPTEWYCERCGGELATM